MGDQLKSGYDLEAMISRSNLKKYMQEVEEQQLDLLDVNRKEFLIVGRSNVGKSSLINNLFEAKAAHISKYPGKTRALSFFRLNLKFQNLILCDAPGYGFAKRSKQEMQAWGKLMGEYISQSKFLHRVVILVDTQHGLMQVDQMIMDLLEYKQKPFQLVFSKVDKAKNQNQIDDLIKKSKEISLKYKMCMPFVSFTSSQNQFGVNQLRATIAYTMELQYFSGFK